MQVTGYASTPREARRFNNLQLARRRAANVAAILQQAGFSVSHGADYPVDQQALLVRDRGMLAFQVVRVSMQADQDKAVAQP